jgi:hypothetical protein
VKAIRVNAAQRPARRRRGAVDRETAKAERLAALAGRGSVIIRYSAPPLFVLGLQRRRPRSHTDPGSLWPNTVISVQYCRQTSSGIVWRNR